MGHKQVEPSPFVTADQYKGGAQKPPQMPALETSAWALSEQKRALSEAFTFLESHRFCDSATRLTACIYRLAMEKTVEDAEREAKAHPVHAAKIYGEALRFVSSSIGTELRDLMKYELEHGEASLFKSRCWALAQEAKSPKISRKAEGLPAKYENEITPLLGRADRENLAASEISIPDQFKILKVAFDYCRQVEDLKWVSDYDGPRFRDVSAKLRRAKEIVDSIAEGGASLKEKTVSLAGKLGVSEDTVKRIIREVAYASFDGIQDIRPEELKALGISPDEVFELDLRKTPGSLNPEIRKFYYALKAEQVLDPDKCRIMTREYLRFPHSHDLPDLIAAYAPLPEQEVEEGAGRILKFMEKTTRVKEKSMDAHPVRAVSWFKQRKGRITEWEKEEIGKAAPPTRLAALRSAQLQYDFLYEQAVYQFTQQVAELRDFIAIYGEGLDPEFKRLVAECIGFDPQSGKDIVSDPEQLGKYLASLEKTLDRWNDLCKEFRKAPYNLERALKGRYDSVAGGMKGEAVTSLVELELALQMRKFGKEREQMQELLENLRVTREDVEARLKSVVQHKRAGDTVYKLAMDLREKELKELDEGEVGKDKKGDG